MPSMSERVCRGWFLGLVANTVVIVTGIVVITTVVIGTTAVTVDRIAIT